MDLLRIAVLFEAIIIAVILALLLFRGGHRWWYEDRHDNAVGRARREIAFMLASELPRRSAVDELRALPLSLQIRVIRQIAPQVLGESRRLIREVAAEVGLVDWALRRTRSGRWWKRLEAVRLLTMLRVDHPDVIALTADVHPLVRAQALEWLADHVDSTRIDAIIQNLGDPSSLCRFTVQDALLRIGRPAVPKLQAWLERNEGEVSAGLQVAAGLAEPRLLPLAIHYASHPLPANRVPAATLLGAIGGENAVDRLVWLLKDEHPEVRASAARALGDLGQWTAASALGRLLHDPDWDTRRQAGLALRSLGAPGRLLLRRYLTGEDGAAADMARQMLDLPGARDKLPVAR